MNRYLNSLAIWVVLFLLVWPGGYQIYNLIMEKFGPVATYSLAILIGLAMAQVADLLRDALERKV
jgi:hypothetical protein